MACTTLWPALCKVFAYAAPGLPTLQISRGRDAMSVVSGGDDDAFAFCFRAFRGVEGVEDGVATVTAVFAWLPCVRMLVAIASCGRSSCAEIILGVASALTMSTSDIIFDILVVSSSVMIARIIPDFLSREVKVTLYFLRS